MAGNKKNSDDNLTSQREAARILGIDPAILSRTWKPRFKKNLLPGFYDNGVNIGEIHAGIIEWNSAKAKQKADNMIMGDDPDDRLKEQRSQKLQLEIQAMRGKMILIEDFQPEISRMTGEYVNAARRVPRTASGNLLSYIAGIISEDIAKSKEVAQAFEKINQGDIEIWMDEQFSRSVGDQGKALDKAWRAAIKRSRIRFE